MISNEESRKLAEEVEAKVQQLKALRYAEGFCWCKYRLINNGEPTLIQVFMRPGHKYLAIDTGPTGFGKRDFTAIAKMGSALWSGPLPQPPEQQT